MKVNGVILAVISDVQHAMDVKADVGVIDVGVTVEVR